jgi:probable phosphoglycerate mutase
MTQILLIRHAVNDFVKTGKLAGWTPGVHLNEEGQAQATALGKRLADTPIDYLYASPLERTMETAEAIRQHHQHLTIQQTTELGEVRYGDWEGMEINKLTGRKMWQVVQQYPSRAEFPNGETMRGVQVRAVNAIEALVTEHPRETVAVVSHADIIKMVLAHYLGMHLDEFQRIVITPASISMLSLGFGRPYVGTMNDMAHILQMEHERKQAKQAEKTA